MQLFTIPNNLNAHTKFLVVPFSIIIFALLIFFIYLNRKELSKYWSKIPKQTKIIIGIIILLSLLLRLTVPSIQHVLFEDEPEFLWTARTIIEEGKTPFEQKSSGWPMIFAIPFAVSNWNNYVPIYISIILGALAPLGIFIMVERLTKNNFAGIISALYTAINPMHIRWSATANAGIAGVTFLVFGLASYFIAKNNKTKNIASTSLTFILLAIASMIRIEFFPIFIMLIIFYVFENRIIKDKKWKTIITILIITILVAPNIFEAISFQTNYTQVETGLKGSGFEKLVVQPYYMVLYSIQTISQFYPYSFSTDFTPLIFSLLLLIGLIFAILNKDKEILKWIIIFIPFLMLFVLEIRFFGGDETPISKTRAFIEFIPLYGIIIGYGVHNLLLILKSKYKPFKKYKIIELSLLIIILVSFIPYIKITHNMYNLDYSKLTTKIYSDLFDEKYKGCTIVSADAYNYKFIKNFDSIRISHYLDVKESYNLSKSCVLYFDDMTCKYWHLTESYKIMCQSMQNISNKTLFSEFRDDATNLSFEMYRLN